ncbi:MAG: SGNH/GDSL hydrolase family protein [Myxococcota bacterium]
MFWFALLGSLAIGGCGDSSDGSEQSPTVEPTTVPADSAPEALEAAEFPLLPRLTPGTVAGLRAVADRVEGRNNQVFAKIGDSATVSRAFLECFARDGVVLGAHGALQPTIDFFRGGNAGGRDPFRRQSVAAEVGWSARQLLIGQPPPLLQEVQAINPRFAFVLSGGNDVEGREPRRYANRMVRIVDRLTTRGVIPILGSITPRNDDPEADQWVRRYNAVNRAIADGRGVPYIDFHQALSLLPRRGLARDGVHPNVYVAEHETRPCDLGEAGLQHGQNVRNLLALQTLDRLRRRLLGGEAATEPELPVAAGTVSNPVRIDAVPFSFFGDTREPGQDEFDRYSCEDAVEEAGGEFVFEISVAEPQTLRLWAYGPMGADVDLHLLARGDPESCLVRADEELVHRLEPGRYFVTVDTFGAEAEEKPGEFVFTVDLAERPAWQGPAEGDDDAEGVPASDEADADTSSEASEDTTREGTAPEDTAPGDTAPEDTASGDTNARLAAESGAESSTGGNREEAAIHGEEVDVSDSDDEAAGTE